MHEKIMKRKMKISQEKVGIFDGKVQFQAKIVEILPFSRAILVQIRQKLCTFKKNWPKKRIKTNSSRCFQWIY